MSITTLLIIFSLALYTPCATLSDPSITIIDPQNKIFSENQPIVLECTFNATSTPIGSLKGKFLQPTAEQLMAACLQKTHLLQLSITCVDDNYNSVQSCSRGSDGLRFCRYLIQHISGDARGLEIFCRDDSQTDSQKVVFNIRGYLFYFFALYIIFLSNLSFYFFVISS